MNFFKSYKKIKKTIRWSNNVSHERIAREGEVPANPLISSQSGNWSDGDRLNGLSPLKQRRKNDLPRYNRLLSSRLSSRVGCAGLCCIALRRCTYSWLGRRRRRKRRCGKSVENARGGAKRTLEGRRRGDGGRGRRRRRRKERYNLLCCQYVAHNDRLLDFSDTPIIVATDLSRSSLAWITWQW